MDRWRPVAREDYDEQLEVLPPAAQVTGRVGGFLLGCEMKRVDGEPRFRAYLHVDGAHYVAREHMTPAEFRRAVAEAGNTPPTGGLG